MGVLGAIGFSSQTKFPGKQIEDNVLNMYSSDSWIAIFLRFCLFFQVSAVNCLIFAAERS
tara:strand:+ start:178 stop:357 length:180 start_codon:yes stop_codon:yes gene_type:complete